MVPPSARFGARSFRGKIMGGPAWPPGAVTGALTGALTGRPARIGPKTARALLPCIGASAAVPAAAPRSGHAAAGIRVPSSGHATQRPLS